MLRNPAFCSFTSSLIVLLMTFVNKPNYLRDLTVFIIPFISLSEIINFVISHPKKFFFWIATSVVDAAAVNRNGFKTLSFNSCSTFFLKDKPVFSNDPKSLATNLPDCSILCNWVFDSFMLAEESFEKAIQGLETFVLINNNLCRKLVSSLELQLLLMKY